MGRFFVDRPIFAAVLSILVTLVGTLADTSDSGLVVDEEALEWFD